MITMMKEQEVLFRVLKDIRDNTVNSSIRRLNNDSSLVPASIDRDYDTLRTVFKTEEQKDAYKRTNNYLVELCIHSILVMFDGGDELTDEFNIDIINADTKKSLLEKIALHEEFFGYLFDVEER
jgi:hypothetical protein